MRVIWRTHAGAAGVLNLEREVEMSGPIHDKGRAHPAQLPGHPVCPHRPTLAMTASLVFEQEYSGVEGDSASCAELLALLSALADSPCAGVSPSPAP